ncbi:MAG: small subunit ribosomal protein [Acidimicrobiaceae bacterium]|nr:small subunit ribosomal protein [Acidimicrobiaceae bacterium]
MARNNDRDRGTRRGTKDTRPSRGKKKVCIFCKDHIEWVDYKDVNLLRRFMSDRGKIRARRVTGNCAQHQRDVAVAIKTARELALLPYTQRTVTERGPGRGPRGDRERPPRAAEVDTADLPGLPDLPDLAAAGTDNLDEIEVEVGAGAEDGDV